MKSVQIWSFFWSAFSRMWTEYVKIRSISPDSVRMLENTDQKKLRIWTLVTQWQKGKESDDEESYDEKILESVIVPPPTTRARQRRNKRRKRNKNVNPKHVIN